MILVFRLTGSAAPEVRRRNVGCHCGVVGVGVGVGSGCAGWTGNAPVEDRKALGVGLVGSEWSGSGLGLAALAGPEMHR